MGSSTVQVISQSAPFGCTLQRRWPSKSNKKKSVRWPEPWYHRSLCKLHRAGRSSWDSSADQQRGSDCPWSLRTSTRGVYEKKGWSEVAYQTTRLARRLHTTGAPISTGKERLRGVSTRQRQDSVDLITSRIRLFEEAFLLGLADGTDDLAIHVLMFRTKLPEKSAVSYNDRAETKNRAVRLHRTGNHRRCFQDCRRCSSGGKARVIQITEGDCERPDLADWHIASITEDSTASLRFPFCTQDKQGKKAIRQEEQ